MIIDQFLFRNVLDQGEKIMMVAHVHPFKAYPRLFSAIFFGVLIPAGAYLLFPPFWMIFLTWIVLGILLFCYRLLQWYLDAWIVTNLGVIKQVWNSFFSKTTNRIEYGNIESMAYEIHGFWGTILRFGSLQITHMSGAQMVLADVAYPHRVERIIMKHQEDFLKAQNYDDHTKLKELLTKLLRSTHKSG